MTLQHLTAWAMMMAGIVFAGESVFGAAGVGDIIAVEFPGFRPLSGNEFATDLLTASKSPGVTRGRFRGRGSEFATFIREKDVNSGALPKAKCVVCRFSKPYHCMTILSFEPRLPYDQRLETIPFKDASCLNGGVHKKPVGDAVALRGVKGTFDYFVFHEGRFIACDPGEPR